MLWRQRIAAVLIASATAWVSFPALGVYAQDTKEKAKAKNKAKPNKLEKKEAYNGELKANPATKLTVPEAQPNSAQDIAKKVDAQLDQKRLAAKVPASPQTDDSEFIRRVTIDLTGTVPTATRVRQFLADANPAKRAMLIDELLDSPKFANRQADVWSSLLYPRESDNRFVGKDGLHEYFAQSFLKNKPWNQTVYDLLTATGKADENKAVTYFLANRTIDKMTDSVSKVFMGLQLQCAQCHNHPFSDWKQTEYWGLAQFFYRVQTSNVKANAKDGTDPGVKEAANVRRNQMNALPEAAKKVLPKYPGDKEQTVADHEQARPYLAHWLTQPQNPFFAKAYVNRQWFLLFGQGIVHPVDNLDELVNAPHKETLEYLAEEFVRSGYDTKHLLRSITLTQAYQRSSRPVEGNKDDAVHYSRMALKVFSPEQLFDSLTQVLEISDEKAKGKKGGNNLNAARSQRDQFVVFFTGTENATPVEYESGIPQALRLMNNNRVNPMKLAERFSRSYPTAEKGIEELYLTLYARLPRPDEMQKLKQFVEKTGSNREAYSDMLWVMLNSSEFTLIR